MQSIKIIPSKDYNAVNKNYVYQKHITHWKILLILSEKYKLQTYFLIKK